MFSLSTSHENGNAVCISKASGPIHVINVATRSAEGCLSNPVTISYAFQICDHFFQLVARFPFVSNFCGSDTLAMNLGDGEELVGVSSSGIFVDSRWRLVQTQFSLNCEFESLNSLFNAFYNTTTVTSDTM